jgi:hypothetical protein
MILRRSILATQAPAASFLLIRLIVGAGRSSLDALMIKGAEGGDG